MAFLMTFTQCVHLVVWLSLLSCVSWTTTTPTTRTSETSTTIATTTSTPTTLTEEPLTADFSRATTPTTTRSARSMTTATTATSPSTTITQGSYENGSQQHFQPFSFGVGIGTGGGTIVILAVVCIVIVLLKKKCCRNKGTQKNDKSDGVWYEDIETPVHSHSGTQVTEVTEYEMIGNMYESLQKGRKKSNRYGELQTGNKEVARKTETPADSSGEREIQGTFYETLKERTSDSQTRSGEIHTEAEKSVKITKEDSSGEREIQGTFYETLKERTSDSQTRSGEIHTEAEKSVKITKEVCEYEMLTPPSKSQPETDKGTDSQTGDDAFQDYKTDPGTDASCGVGDTHTEEKSDDALSTESDNAEHGFPPMEISVTEDEELSSESDCDKFEALQEVYNRIQRGSVDFQTRTSLSGLPVIEETGEEESMMSESIEEFNGKNNEDESDYSGEEDDDEEEEEEETEKKLEFTHL